MASPEAITTPAPTTTPLTPPPEAITTPAPTTTPLTPPPEDDAARKRIINYFIAIIFVQACLAVVLLVCGFRAVHYTSGTGLFGPPYAVGSFIGGVLMIPAGIAMFFIICQTKTTDPTSTSDQRRTSRLFFLECLWHVSSAVWAASWAS